MAETSSHRTGCGHLMVGSELPLDGLVAVEPDRRRIGGAPTCSSTLAAVVHAGDPAPEFVLLDQHGDTVRLSDLRGRWVLLWWYPKAATPG